MTRLLPVMMKPDETICVQQAAGYARKSEKTIRRLCQKYGIYRQTSPSAPWEISRVGLEMALCQDGVGIELLRAGQRSDPRVRRYLDHLGISE